MVLTSILYPKLVCFALTLVICLLPITLALGHRNSTSESINRTRRSFAFSGDLSMWHGNRDSPVDNKNSLTRRDDELLKPSPWLSEPRSRCRRWTLGRGKTPVKAGCRRQSCSRFITNEVSARTGTLHLDVNLIDIWSKPNPLRSMDFTVVVRQHRFVGPFRQYRVMARVHELKRNPFGSRRIQGHWRITVRATRNRRFKPSQKYSIEILKAVKGEPFEVFCRTKFQVYDEHSVLENDIYANRLIGESELDDSSEYSERPSFNSVSRSPRFLSRIPRRIS